MPSFNATFCLVQTHSPYRIGLAWPQAQKEKRVCIASVQCLVRMPSIYRTDQSSEAKKKKAHLCQQTGPTTKRDAYPTGGGTEWSYRITRLRLGSYCTALRAMIDLAAAHYPSCQLCWSSFLILILNTITLVGGCSGRRNWYAGIIAYIIVIRAITFLHHRRRRIGNK